MSSAQKRSFSAFLRPVSEPPRAQPMEEVASPPDSPPLTSAEIASGSAPASHNPAAPERVRHVTTTGRVRTHTASRQLPGVTLRLAEDRWERLKMLSIQERRPIQEILGDAMEAYMRARGLPW